MIKNLLPAEFSWKKNIPLAERDCASAYGNNKTSVCGYGKIGLY